jgi:hypothetical protein
MPTKSYPVHTPAEVAIPNFRESFENVYIVSHENGIIYERLYVSKWCSSWRNLKIGSKWKFDEVTYQKGKEVYTKVDKVSELCSQLKSL